MDERYECNTCCYAVTALGGFSHALTKICKHEEENPGHVMDEVPNGGEW